MPWSCDTVHTPLVVFSSSDSQLCDISMFACRATVLALQERMVAKDDDAVASASTKIRLFLTADWLISTSFQPQA